MKNLLFSKLAVMCKGLLSAALLGISLSSCIVPRRPPPPVVAADDAGVVAVLPTGARPVVIRGEHVWVRRGVYYRRHPHGYVVFRP